MKKLVKLIIGMVLIVSAVSFAANGMVVTGVTNSTYFTNARTNWISVNFITNPGTKVRRVIGNFASVRQTLGAITMSNMSKTTNVKTNWKYSFSVPSTKLVSNGKLFDSLPIYLRVIMSNGAVIIKTAYITNCITPINWLISTNYSSQNSLSLNVISFSSTANVTNYKRKVGFNRTKVTPSWYWVTSISNSVLDAHGGLEIRSINTTNINLHRTGAGFQKYMIIITQPFPLIK